MRNYDKKGATTGTSDCASAHCRRHSFKLLPVVVLEYCGKEVKKHDLVLLPRRCNCGESPRPVKRVPVAHRDHAAAASTTIAE